MRVKVSTNRPLIMTHDVVPAFDPLTEVPSTLLYLNHNNFTPSSWLDQAPNNYDYAQPIGTKQPTLGSNRVIFDGGDDIMTYSQLTAPYTDGNGMMFFSGYNAGAFTQYFHTTANTANNQAWLIFGLDSTGHIIVWNRIGGFTRNVRSTNTVPIGSYFYASVKDFGATWSIRLMGVDETVVVTSGLNQGNWYDTLTIFGDTNNSSVGGLLTTSESNTPTEINKILLLSEPNPPNLANIETFMSNPNT